MSAVPFTSTVDPLLAQVLLFWQLLPGSLRETLIVIAAMATISVAVLAWALVIRKPGRRHHHHRHHHRHHKEQVPSADDSQQEPRRKWRRRRRRDHRPRNPTLAETGGLPPVRSHPPIDPSL